MVVLDTDHLTLLERSRGAGNQVLQDRLDRLEAEPRATTIVTYEEQTRGWMAYMARAKTVVQEIEAYARLKARLSAATTFNRA
jgi:tRNA(fMet)-specific endonuclease VapC